MLGPRGPELVEVRGNRVAAAIARYESAVGRWAAGDPAALRRLRGRSVSLADGTRVPLLVDEAQLRELARAGLLHLPGGLYPEAEAT